MNILKKTGKINIISRIWLLDNRIAFVKEKNNLVFLGGISKMNNTSRNFRTDLALEIKEDLDYDIDGVIMRLEEDVENEIIVTTVEILNENGEQEMEKPIGTYITIECGNMGGSNKDIHDLIIEYGVNKMKELFLDDFSTKKNLLVVGLGNEYVTPDALGPKVISKLLVTRHIKESFDESLKEKIISLSGIAPGVMGQTGIETVEVIKGITERTKPDLIIVIDALASRNIDRINRTIQISNTGIAPGSGVGNKRKAIDKETLGIEVISIGIPTVVDAPTLVNDTLNLIIDEMIESSLENGVFYDLLKNLEQEEKYELIKKCLSPTLSNMFVTPKEVDQVIERLSNIVANIINLSAHSGLTLEDINYFMV